MQALLIPATMAAVLVVAVFFRIPAIENPCIRMFADTRHNGWMAVICIWAAVFTIVGWNHSAFVSPLQSLDVAELATSMADNRETAIERLDKVSGILQLGSLIDWADPVNEEVKISTWRGNAAVASWIILFASALWVWSDDALTLFALVGALFSRQTASASATAGGGGQTAAPTGATSATSRWGKFVERYGDDFAIEALFKMPELPALWRQLKTIFNRAR